jgi:glycosyltransferase involved in cell wall biosynthesis
MASAERHLVTIGHSYVVAENRRLAHEIAIAGRGRWRVTVLAPASFPGDLRAINLEPIAGEASDVRPVRVRFGAQPHVMHYAGLSKALPRDADVVHSWEEPYVFAGAQIARAAPPASRFVFATFQNLPKHYPWPFASCERASVRRADGWIAFGHTVYDTLGGRDGYDAKPHRVIPPGVDVDRFKPDPEAGRLVRRSLGWSDSIPVVGFLGRFVPQKGIHDLLAALDRMKAPWKALFVGGGPLQADLERFAAAHPDRVHVASGVPHGDVPRWLNAMSVLCAPSLTTKAWREQFGRMLIEAMACGVPVLSSASGEMPQVVGDAGRVLPEANPDRWAFELDVLLSDVNLQRDLAGRGRARVQALFSWPVVAQRHLEFFDSLVGA